MSAGLGTIQRAILEALLPSKRLHAEHVLHYRGGSWSDYRPTTSIYHGREIKLPDEAFDVRAVKALLTRVFGTPSRAYYNTFDPSWAFNAAFSRALRSLIRRGVLQRWGVKHYADVYSAYPRELPEIRFVTCPAGPPTKITTPALQKEIEAAERWAKQSIASILAASGT